MSGPLSAMLTACRRALHALVHPGADEERDRMNRLERMVTDQVGATRRDVGELSKQIADLGVEKSLHVIERRLEHVVERLTQVRAAAGRQYKATAQALRHAEWQEEQRALERRVGNRLARISRSERPVVIGPWTGEVGFELLYWIPFVTWALERASIAPERVLVVSRGGAAPWYVHLGGQYADILSFVSPQIFREQTEALKKQRTVSSFDRTIIRQVMKRAGLGRAHLIHPDLMYRLFYPFWKQQATVRRIEDFTVHRLLEQRSRPDVSARLPPNYVAVRFYFSDSFPDTPTNRAFVDTTIRSLAETTDVVLLNTAFSLDDHRDYSPGTQARIHTIDDLMAPNKNLDVQTAVIAGARAFVGTYGGYAYLAPLCGVSSLAFYSERDAFFAHHLELAERVFRRLRAASLVPIDVRDADLIRSALSRPGAVVDLGNR